MNKRFLGFICLVILIGFFFAGLWPFNFISENEVKWLKDSNGISFYGNGMIYTPDLLNGKNPPFQNSSITIEMWLQPKVKCDCFLARILSLYDGHKSENFFIGQWKYDLAIGGHTIKPDNNIKYKEVGLDDVLIKDKKMFITITSGNDSTIVYVDGKQVRSFPQLQLIYNNKASGYLIIGNSPTGKQYWTGELYGLAIYNQILSSDKVLKNYQAWTSNGVPETSTEESPLALYLFDEKTGTFVKNHSGPHDLLIPVKFTPFKKVILSPPWESFKFDHSYLKDVAINFFGFIPFGFFILALMWDPIEPKRLRVSILVILMGGGLSLIIELIQANLPTRSSSLSDLILNTLGTIAGVILFNMFSGKIEDPDSTRYLR